MMPVVLASIGIVVWAACAAAVVVSVVLWRVTAPPVFVPAEAPRVMRRAIRWWLVATMVFVWLTLVWLVLRTPLGLPRHGVYRFVPLALAMTPVLVVNPLYLWRTAWLRRAASRAGGRLCTFCAYDLSGLEGTRTCPECGKASDAEADERSWRAVAVRGSTEKR